MTHRIKNCPNSLNLDGINCESYLSKLLRKEKSPLAAKKPSTAAATCLYKCKERGTTPNKIPATSTNQLSRARANVKQQNMPSLKSPNQNVVQYTASDDSAMVEVTVKTNKQRSRSTVTAREPWGQLLKQQKSNREHVSLFSNFDPLRTLHFLAKELQIQLQAILPDDISIQQMVSDMQNALKRVPPEVASTIHLQQAIDMLPSHKKSASMKSLTDEKPEKLKPHTPNLSEKNVQTVPTFEREENERIQKIMEESTLKLETSCKQLEGLCTILKNEKEHLERQLEAEKNSVQFLKRRIEDLEFENKELPNNRLKKLEDEKMTLELQVSELKSQIESQTITATTEIKSLLSELKSSKSNVAQECTKLKHQLRLCAIEKEKYVAVLAVRDRQISEIRNEMTQLQEVVNDQLVELHNNAVSAMPSRGSLSAWKAENQENVGDGTISSIHTNEDQLVHVKNKPSELFKDLQSGDNDTMTDLQDLPENDCEEKIKRYFSKSPQFKICKNEDFHLEAQIPALTNISQMFNEIKRQAYAVASKTKST